MQLKPHDYQQYAIDFIVENPVSAVLLDMGMGKTVITLTAIEELMFTQFEIVKVLIIAPLRVARTTWPEEIKKWDHMKGIRYSVAVGTAKERRRALEADADIYVINRENIPWLIEKSGIPFDYDMVVIDELSSFKNHRAKRTQALMRVRPNVERIVGLTGTPSPNGLMDLYSEYKLLDMGQRLGPTIGQYRYNYFLPDQEYNGIVCSYRLRPGADKLIYDKIADITISMKGTDYLKMPELVNSEYLVYLDAVEREQYETMKEDMVLELEGGEVTAANAACLSQKLTQMANGAVYSDDGAVEVIHDRKLEALEDIIEAANGKPLMVAYWYRHDLERITKKLTELNVPFARLDTDESIRKWNAGQLPVALIHPASAGHGLNLQSGGNTLVWFGMNWSLELYQQTVARLWRQGQQSETVIMQHILTAGTVDERIMQAIHDKGDMQSALIDAVKAEVASSG